MGRSLASFGRKSAKGSSLGREDDRQGNRYHRSGMASRCRRPGHYQAVVVESGYLELVSLCLGYYFEQRLRTVWPLRPLHIQNHVYCLLHLKNAFSICLAQRLYIDGHALERSVEKFVPVQQAGNASLALTRKEFQERRQIFGAYNFVWQYAV